MPHDLESEAKIARRQYDSEKRRKGQMTAKHTPKQVDCICNKSTVRVEKLTAGPYIVTCWGCDKRTSQQVERGLAIKEWNETIAAPELLAACEWTSKGEHHRACSHYKKSPDTCDCYVGAAKTAIRKAKGA